MCLPQKHCVGTYYIQTCSTGDRHSWYITYIIMIGNNTIIIKDMSYSHFRLLA